MILKSYIRTNCKECGEPTCMVLAAHMAEGVKGPQNCLPLDGAHKRRLGEYMSRFKFDT